MKVFNSLEYPLPNEYLNSKIVNSFLRRRFILPVTQGKLPRHEAIYIEKIRYILRESLYRENAHFLSVEMLGVYFLRSYSYDQLHHMNGRPSPLRCFTSQSLNYFSYRCTIPPMNNATAAACLRSLNGLSFSALQVQLRLRRMDGEKFSRIHRI